MTDTRPTCLDCSHGCLLRSGTREQKSGRKCKGPRPALALYQIRIRRFGPSIVLFDEVNYAQCIDGDQCHGNRPCLTPTCWGGVGEVRGSAYAHHTTPSGKGNKQPHHPSLITRLRQDRRPKKRRTTHGFMACLHVRDCRDCKCLVPK